LNNQQQDGALILDVSLEKESLKINLRPGTEMSGSQPYATPAGRSLAALASQYGETRREVQRLEGSPAALNLRNEIFTLERLVKRLKRAKWKSPTDLTRLAELPRLNSALKAINEFAQKITELEHQALLAVYGKSDADEELLKTRLDAADGEWIELLISIYSLKFKEPDRVTLAIFSEEASGLFNLAGVYYQLAMKYGADIAAYQFSLKRGERSVAIDNRRIENIESFLSSPRDVVIGVALGLEFPLAYPRFEAERGLHQFTRAKKVLKCLVEISEKPVSSYQPPAGIERHGAIGHQEKRRNYNFDQSFIEDAMLRRKSPWSGHALDDALGELIEECLLMQARTLID
jgi:hypothetical protein